MANLHYDSRFTSVHQLVNQIIFIFPNLLLNLIQTNSEFQYCTNLMIWNSNNLVIVKKCEYN